MGRRSSKHKREGKINKEGKEDRVREREKGIVEGDECFIQS